MNRKLDILHFSLHGLIRGHDLELGRDSDTGGQCLYVLELVRALARHPDVARTTLVTRRIFDSRVSDDYAVAWEKLEENADIRRIEAGTRRYLRKEVLWRHLDAFIDGTLAWLRRERRVPDLIHAHYADAGYVGRQVAAVLGIPFAFTGHSLGRVKRQRLLDGGVDESFTEKNYNLAARIEAEELSLEAASLVCTSTHQEVERQYAIYHHYTAETMRVIPPGVRLSRFEGEGNRLALQSVDAKISPFLRDPSKPVAFAIARADERKNLAGLLRAFGKNPWLRENANLLIVGGNRKSLAELPPGARKVWMELLRLVDDFNLYGNCAFPKNHEAAEVPEFFRWAADRGGVFVNPAFTEPFGLTLLEAAAAGLPIVATNDGGPQDILANCQNGTLVDAMHDKAIGDAIEEIIAEPRHQQHLAALGKSNVRKFYSWDSHVATYLAELRKILPTRLRAKPPGSRQFLASSERWIAMDFPPDLELESPDLINRWREVCLREDIGVIYATGLPFLEARDVIERLDMPRPSIIISGLGANIRYGWITPIRDEVWCRQARMRWNRQAILDTLATLPHLTMQAEERQDALKISYLLDEKSPTTRAEIQRHLRQAGLAAKVTLSSGCFVDILPIRSGKDVAMRYLTMKWGIDPGLIYYFGTYGNDASVIRGRNLAAVAAGADSALRRFRSRPRLYQCKQPGLMGFFEGLSHYGFLAGKPPPLATEKFYSENEEVPPGEMEP